MGAGTGFRVTLEAECRLVCAMNALQRTIKQRAMRGAQAVWQTLFVHRKTVVLTSDHYYVVIYIFHWVVGAMMTKFHLRGFGTRSQSQQLMTT